MTTRIGSLAAIAGCAVCALPLAAQTATTPVAVPALASAAAAPGAAAVFASADFEALDVSDSAFEPRPAEQLTGPWDRSITPFEAEFGDGRRTLGRFPGNLGRNLVGVVARDNLKPFLASVVATGAGALLDTRTQRYFGEAPRWPALGRAGQKLGDPRNLTMLAATLFTAGRVAHGARFRAATYDVAQAFVVNAAWTGALKYGVRRERPDASNRQSFPSGHTSNAFAWAAIADHHYGHKLGLPAYGVAGLIGLSRLEKNVHHLSDVLAGAALGYVVGRTVVHGDGEGVRRGKPRFTLAPTSDARGHGVGLAVSGTF